METYGTLIAASAFFVVSHLIMSSAPFKGAVVARIGQNGFLGIYSLVAIAALWWMIDAYSSAPPDYLWIAPTWIRHLPMGLMLPACILIVAGYSKNPTAVGVDASDMLADGPKGIYRVARQPVMAGIAIWSLTHVLASGQASAVILQAAVGVLAVAGMLHIERRKASLHGEAWSAYAAQSSLVPFLAILQGRQRFVMSEIGWARVLAGAAVYAVLVVLHGVVIGVPPLPLGG